MNFYGNLNLVTLTSNIQLRKYKTFNFAKISLFVIYQLFIYLYENVKLITLNKLLCFKFTNINVFLRKYKTFNLTRLLSFKYWCIYRLCLFNALGLPFLRFLESV